MPTNRFDGVDLGTSASLRRMVRSIQRQRAEIMTDVIVILTSAGHHEAAELVRKTILAETEEVAKQPPDNP